jgi:uncharacterized protein YgiM (DUF1202 family)
MRARPTTESAILTQLKAGEHVTLIFQDKEWYLVRLPSDRLVWAYHSLFRDQGGQPAQPLLRPEATSGNNPARVVIKPSPKSGVIDVPVANMRARPTNESPLLDQLRAGERVTLLFQENEWFVVRLPDDRLAWAHQSLFRGQERRADSREPEPKQVVEKTASQPFPLKRR